MKRIVFDLICLAAWLLLGLWMLLNSPHAQAGQVILTMPDEQLKGAVEEVCTWTHCQSTDNGGYKTDQEKADWVLQNELKAAIDTIISLKTQGHVKNLDSLKGSLVIRYDQEEP